MKPISTVYLAKQNKTQPYFMKALLVFALVFLMQASNAFAHVVDYFTTCGYVCSGSSLTVNAHVSATNSSTRYNWQYKDNSNTWKCFVNGNNTINGTSYSVSNATATGQLSNGPLLTVQNATSALNNVYVRLLMADGSSPCSASTTWGGGEVMQLHVLSGAECANIDTYCGSGGKCLKGCKSDPRVGAKISWTINRSAGTVTIRTTLAKTFVDNTYGSNTIGWPGGGGSGNHKFNHLVTSDALQLSLYNGNNSKVLEFQMDYFSENSSKPSGYGTTGVTSNDGSMIVGSASNILSVKTSLDENFNTYGYKLTSNSPATDANYTPNASYRNWIYDVWYEVTVKLSAFGSAGFKTANIPYLHASPSKTGNDTECLIEDANCTSTDLNLGNLVWNDMNGNGLKDTNEPGIAGVTVNLYRDADANNTPDNTTPIAVTTTNASGFYSFTSLSAGNYIVGVVVPTGYVVGPIISTSSTPNNNIDNDNNGVTKSGSELRSKYITLSAGQEPDASVDGDGTNGNLTLDFALCGQGALGDFVWNDANNNGIQDAGEQGIANAIVTLTFPNGTVSTTTTNSSGIYKFINLGPLTYTVKFTAPAGYNPALSNQGSDDAKDSDPVNGLVTVTLAPQQINYTIDAGFYTGSVSVGNLVWNDWNGNGLKEAGEPGVGGVTVRLYRDANANNVVDNNTPIATTTTSASGAYFFGNLAPGNYIVGAVIPSGYTITGASFADPNDNRDNDNNGSNVINQAEIRSNFITLTVGAEPEDDGDGSNSNLTLDFGICGRANLGDFVWNDYNNNGIQDAGEPGISGVSVTLTFPEGTTTSTITDANGKYLFINLGPGVHQVAFETPAGFAPSPSNAGSDDAKDSDPVNGVVSVTMVASTHNLTVDAGYSQPGILTLGNLVWNDWDGNGIKNVGEPGVEGVTVKLYRDDNANNVPDGAAIATTVTGPGGLYYFKNLNPGNYITGVIIPSGYTITATSFSNPNDDKDNDNNGINVINQSEYRTNYITLTVGGEPDVAVDGDDKNGNLTLDIGICGRGKLGDFVWNDTNANGIQDAGEIGIPNVRVTLTFPDGVTTTSMVTDANGKYLFINLGPGTHKVSFATPTGLVASPANQGSDDAKDSDPINGEVLVTLDPLEVDLTVDAGFTAGGTLNLGNIVWNDFDGDGKRDSNEPPIAGITVSLYRDDNNDNLPDANLVIATTVTNSLGIYNFTGLRAGRYIASIPIIAGYLPGGVASTSANPDNDIDDDNNAINKVGNVMFTNAITLSVGGEPITDGDGNNGNLTFDLALCGNSWIGDFVWDDLNKNGIQDANEPGINGVEVRLTQPGSVIRTTTTFTYNGKDGYYDFARLGPGTYTVTFVTPSGYTPSPANQGANDAIDSDPINGSVSVTLAANESNFTIDAGFYSTGVLELGNLVWNDINGNGLRELDEPGIDGIIVKLYRDNNNDNLADNDAVVATTTTASGGYYNFSTLNEGRYIVGITMPAGYTTTPVSFNNPDNNVDNDNNGVRLTGANELRTNAITLAAGTEPDIAEDGDDKDGNLTLDLAIRGTSTIGDFVWFDYNNNGIQNAGEPGMPNIRVTITFEDGTTRTVRTNSNGNYYFSNLGPGTYTLTFTTPLGFTTSPANQGSDDTKDSDPVDGEVTVTLAANESNLTIDAGIWDDVDRDDDGIDNLTESGGYYPLRDCDDDGIPNYMDPTSGCAGLVWVDCLGDGINDFFDFDQDGIINELDLDSDNDGILDIQEARDSKAPALSILDANRDGQVDGPDTDGDGLRDLADTTPTYGGPGLTPQDFDRDGNPNYKDLDSDGDGITDLTEALELFDADGLVNGFDTDGDGVLEDNNFEDREGNADNFNGFGAKGITLKDRDGDGYPNPYDIDSDNDGITDNVEGQATCSERQPTGLDDDKDGIDNAYDVDNNCIPRGGGIRPYDKDGDTTPDIYDLDTDNDKAPDVNEGSGIYGNFVTNFGDADADGLIDQFDVFNIRTATSLFTHNVAHNEMGPNGNFDGPTPSGSNARLPKSVAGGCNEGVDRDWRNVTILPVTLVDFKGNLNNGQVKLTWVVANESNMEHYNVERSVNGSTFTSIGKVVANNTNRTGNVIYNLSDDVSTLSNTTVYYRLQQVERAGTSRLSNVVTFKLNNKTGYAIGIHPNPALAYFNVKVNASADGVANIRITDFTGRTVLSKVSRLNAGSNVVTFNNLSNIAAGTYNVQVLINGELLNEKVIISK